MSGSFGIRDHRLRIPEIPRFAPGLALMTGGMGFALGADALTSDMIAGLLIVELAASGLIVSAGLGRSERQRRFHRKDVNAEGARQFRRELLRARRHETPLALVRLPGPVAAKDRSSVHRQAAEVRRRLRRIDVVWVRGGDVLLVLPETDGVIAARAIERLRACVPAAFTAGEPTIAAFPGDGLTAAALLAIADGRPALGPAPSPTPVQPPAPALPTASGTVPAARIRTDGGVRSARMGGAALKGQFVPMSPFTEPVADRERPAAELNP